MIYKTWPDAIRAHVERVTASAVGRHTTRPAEFRNEFLSGLKSGPILPGRSFTMKRRLLSRTIFLRLFRNYFNNNSCGITRWSEVHLSVGNCYFSAGWSAGFGPVEFLDNRRTKLRACTSSSGE